MLLKKYQTGGKAKKVSLLKHQRMLRELDSLKQEHDTHRLKSSPNWRREKEQNIKDKETAIKNISKGDLVKNPSKEYMKKKSKQLQVRQYESNLREGFLEGRPSARSMIKPGETIKRPVTKGKQSLSGRKGFAKKEKALLLKEYTKKLKKEGKGELLSGTFRNEQPRKKKDAPTLFQKGGKVLQKQSGREYRKSLENAPDLENDLWDKFISGGNMVLPQLVKEQRARDAKVKAKKMEKTGLKMPKAAGGSLPLGEGGKKKKKTTDMSHGMYSVTKGVKGKMPQHKLMKKAKLLKK